ncbi:MAG TPA: GNAT family N-acetyltransferase [Gemmatimonadales bacterium]|nr:GNAT family N-acetyltransferase [Gemmatimonadales bacterium]
MTGAIPGRYLILRARPGDVPRLAAIELAAATLLRGHAPDAVLREVTEEPRLRAAQRQGRLWVALADAEPVGFAHVELLEPGMAHLEEIDVHPDHGRRGLGRRLVAEVCRWAARHGYRGVTLTTFRHLRWNMPFYASLGFTPLPSDALSPALSAVVQNERRRGLDPATRVVMAWESPTLVSSDCDAR